MCLAQTRRVYTPILQPCHNTSNVITKLHPVNLILLQDDFFTYVSYFSYAWLIFLPIIFFFLFRRFKKPQVTMLYLELTNGIDCMLVPVLALPTCPTFWNLHSACTLQAFKVKGLLRPKLSLDWGGLTITNTLSHQSLYPPTSIPLTYYQAYKLNKIIHSSFYLFIIMGHKQLAFYMLVCPDTCPVHPASIPETDSRTAKLYGTV